MIKNDQNGKKWIKNRPRVEKMDNKWIIIDQKWNENGSKINKKISSSITNISLCKCAIFCFLA